MRYIWGLFISERTSMRFPAYAEPCSASEHEHQVAFMSYASIVAWHGFETAEAYVNSRHGSIADFAHLPKHPYPELKWLHAIPNGGSRGETEKDRMIAGGKLKAEGVKRGIPDLFLPVARQGLHGMYIEMKKFGGRPTPEQIEFGNDVQRQGYSFNICRGWREAADVLKWYLT